MSRKDLEEFAKMVKDLEGVIPERERRIVMAHVAEVFEVSNERFDFERFKSACGF